MTELTVTQSEAWRLAYRQERYCEHIALDELKRRIRDIFLTLWTLTPEAKIAMLPMDVRGRRWLELWTHAHEELSLRGQGLTPDVLHREPLPDLVGRLAKRASAALVGVPEQGCLLKFGKPEHMVSMYEQGSIRVQTASFYRRPELNGAIRDDELALELSLRALPLPGNPATAGRLNLLYEHKSDYWLYCLSSSVQPRHFVDFEAEACVVIKSPQRFLGALTAAFAAKNSAASVWHGKVGYIDPLLPWTLNFDVSRTKHFRYWYQHEYRVVWRPPSPIDTLAYVDIEIGPMHEYAELVRVGAAEA